MPSEGTKFAPGQRDLDLLTRARAGDGAAVEALLEAYKPLVLSRASQYYLAHGDRDDLIQEGMIALFQAVASCPPDRFANFSAYAFHAVNNRILDLLRREQSQKRQTMLKTLSLEAQGEEDSSDLGRSLGVTIRGDQTDPEDRILFREQLELLTSTIAKELSSQERQVLKAYLAGQTYEAIAQELGLTPKSVDASLQRARRKLRQKLS